MPEFAYTARNLAGEDVTGTITAASKRETLNALAEQSLFPLSVLEKRTRAPLLKRGVSSALLANTLTQLADLLENGVALLSSLQILAEQCPHPTLSEVLLDVRDQVSEGESLESAMAHHQELFGELTISMVRAGSEGAFLEDALKRVATFLEKQQELKSRITGAMIYPAFLGAMGFTVTVVLVVFFVPMFADLFSRLEQEGGGLPLPTVVLLWLSDVLTHYGLLLAIVAVGTVLWGRQFAKRPSARRFLDRWKLKIPVIGPIFHNYAISRFCRILGTLLRNGVPLLRALDISRDSAGNRVLSEAIRQSAENVSAGETLAGPLSSCGLIPKTVMAMIRVGEEANNLDDVLVNVADGIDRRTERQIDIMVRLAEPAMLMVMGTVVGFVLVALLLPVFDTMALIG